jgi:hypothetical protein
MKKYLEFIIEARNTRATEKAANLGLVSDGHGYWMDRSGRTVAKTEKGDLVFIKKKSPAVQKAQATPSPTRPSLRQDSPLQKRELPTRQVKPQKEEPAPPTPKTSEILTIVFGRFNPPTIGHGKLLQKAKEVSQGGDLKIYPSRMYGDPVNPLSPSDKIYYMRKAFPKFADNIINDNDMNNIFDVLKRAEEDGYDTVNLVTGAKRRSEFDRLANRYNGEIYSLNDIKVIALPSEDPDLENSPNPTSSSGLRKAAVEDDFFAFQKGLPKTLDAEKQKALFFAVQRSLESDTIKNESWKVAPESNYNMLKEEYYKEKVFKNDNIVENINTGLKGKIIRRGPNYVICVNEDLDIMFKSWIVDIREWTDVSGVPAEQREVGTDAYRDYVIGLSGVKVISNFLKKRKNKLNSSKN